MIKFASLAQTESFLGPPSTFGVPVIKLMQIDTLVSLLWAPSPCLWHLRPLRFLLLLHFLHFLRQQTQRNENRANANQASH